MYSKNNEELPTTQSGVVSPVQANPSLRTGSSISLQTCALHCWVGNMTAVKNTTLVEIVRRDNWMARFKDSVKVKHTPKPHNGVLNTVCEMYADECELSNLDWKTCTCS